MDYLMKDLYWCLRGRVLDAHYVWLAWRTGVRNRARYLRYVDLPPISAR